MAATTTTTTITTTVSNNKGQSKFESLDWFNRFDSKNLIYGEPKKNAKGGFSIPVAYNDNGRICKILFQGPRARLPFGVSVFNEEKRKQYGKGGDGGDKSGENKDEYSLSYSFDGVNSDERMKRWHQVWTAIDEANIAAAVKNAEAWFGKKISEETIRDRYNASVQKPKDQSKGYADTLKTKLNTAAKTGQIITQFFDSSKPPKPMKYTDCTPFSEGIGVISFQGLWFVAKGFGPRTITEQVKVYPAQNFTTCVIQDGDEDAEMEDAPTADVSMGETA
jgi:uncharacterized protein DUF5871